jgi:hypothetical protein
MKTTIRRNFNFLLLAVIVAFGLYIIEIFDLIAMYEIFISIPLSIIILGSLVLFVITIIEIYKLKRLPNTLSILLFLIIILCWSTIYVKRNGFFWHKFIVASFIDDFSRTDITMYSNGKYIIFDNWLFGEQRYEGNYKMKGDTIVFKKIPVTDNNFISKEIILDRMNNRIYFRKDENGNYDKSFYYFQIDN